MPAVAIDSATSDSTRLPLITPAANKPAAQTLPPEPAKPAASKPATTTAAVTKPAEPVSATKPAPAPPAASAVGFAVQLGAFGSAAEANKLRDRARAAGFSAFVEQVRTDKGVLNRVRVGPVVSRAEADQLKAQVSSKLRVSGIVRPHP